MNKRIRFARGVKDRLIENNETLAPGQPFYNMTNKQLYIGDGETTLNDIRVNSANNEHRGIAVKNAISAGMISGILCVPYSNDSAPLENQTMPYIEGDYSKGIIINAGPANDIILSNNESGTTTIDGNSVITGVTTIKDNFFINKGDEKVLEISRDSSDSYGDYNRLFLFGENSCLSASQGSLLCKYIGVMVDKSGGKLIDYIDEAYIDDLNLYGDLIPSTHSTSNIGASNKKINNIYCNNIIPSQLNGINYYDIFSADSKTVRKSLISNIAEGLSLSFADYDSFRDIGDFGSNYAYAGLKLKLGQINNSNYYMLLLQGSMLQTTGNQQKLGKFALPKSASVDYVSISRSYSKDNETTTGNGFSA